MSDHPELTIEEEQHRQRLAALCSEADPNPDTQQRYFCWSSIRSLESKLEQLREAASHAGMVPV